MLTFPSLFPFRLISFLYFLFSKLSVSAIKKKKKKKKLQQIFLTSGTAILANSVHIMLIQNLSTFSAEVR